VIGVEKAIAIHRFVKKTPGERMRPAKGAGTLCGAIIDINTASGHARAIHSIRVGGVLSPSDPSI
jgi:calcineurin-like phosphoesterase